MTRTEDRLTDALGAAAQMVREDTLRLLYVPRRRPRPTWLAPAAAALGVLLVAGLATALALGNLPGHGGFVPVHATGTGPDPYYITTSLNGGQPVVRSTATGAVTATVPVPEPPRSYDLVAPAADGSFFAVAGQVGGSGEQLYHFGLTAGGQVTGFAQLPGGVLGGPDRTANAMAVSPDGSQVAISFTYEPLEGCPGGQSSCTLQPESDYVDVVSTQTGAVSVWRAGPAAPSQWFTVGDLSWNGSQLVYLGQWCTGSYYLFGAPCDPRNSRTAEVQAVDPAADPAGGDLASGKVLLRQSAQFPYIVQAVISPDGATLTAAVLSGPVVGTGGNSGFYPEDLAVEQISVATGTVQDVMYRTTIGSAFDVNLGPQPIALMPDGSGETWLLSLGLTDGSNGWIHDGTLVPLNPTNGQDASEAW